MVMARIATAAAIPLFFRHVFKPMSERAELPTSRSTPSLDPPRHYGAVTPQGEVGAVRCVDGHHARQGSARNDRLPVQIKAPAQALAVKAI
jgi:hypothetical protein